MVVVVAVVERLMDLALFQHLSDVELQGLADAGGEEERGAGEVVCAEKAPADTFYVILSGRVRVERRGDDGAAVELATLEAGQSFGEPALFDASPRSATVVALEPSRFFVLSRGRFLDFLFEHPRVLSDVMSGIGGQIRAAHQKSFWDLLHAQSVRAEMEEERYRALAELVAGVAHEVNTPLGIVNTAASILADRLTDLAPDDADRDAAEAWDDAQEAVRLIQGNLARANRLVESFKHLSARQAVARVEEHHLAAVVEDVIAAFAPQARGEGVDVAFCDERADRSQAWVGDAGAVSQILMNLLANAQRYAYPEGGGRVDVVLADNGNGTGDLALTVRDHGVGIPHADQQRVFEPFFTTGRARGGTGLGLAIVHNLATTTLGGSLTLTSQPGSGTEFRVVLPRAPRSSQPPTGPMETRA